MLLFSVVVFDVVCVSVAVIVGWRRIVYYVGVGVVVVVVFTDGGVIDVSVAVVVYVDDGVADCVACCLLCSWHCCCCC